MIIIDDEQSTKSLSIDLIVILLVNESKSMLGFVMDKQAIKINHR